jgi:hypothetical protein
MPCAFCGEGDRWIKTCRVKDGSLLRVCDPCYEALSQWLVIVPGDVVVTARCDGVRCVFQPQGDGGVQSWWSLQRLLGDVHDMHEGGYT